MPPICLHLVIARDAATRLGHSTVDRNLGSYLLGSTLPDFHIMMGQPRERTHFFDLAKEPAESGIKPFLKAYPELSEGAGLADDTRALVSGYLCHLATDEVWIIDIYRPLFGPASPLGDEPMANLLDRTLQYELDLRSREDEGDMSQIRALLGRLNLSADIGPIDASAVRRWHERVSSASNRVPTWDDFPAFAERFLVPFKKVEPEPLERFLASLPAKREWVLSYVGRERIEAFREKAVSHSVTAAQEYLN